MNGFESTASVAFQPAIFEKPIISNEGYFQLTWEVTGAPDFDGSFRVSELVGSGTEGSSDGQGTTSSSVKEVGDGLPARVVYEGTLPTAFVSGLPDGTYHYRVEALDANGRVIAVSAVPATVQVQHWLAWQATLLLAIGAVVFLAVVVVIVRGTWMHRSTSGFAESNDQAPEEPTEGSQA